MFHIIDDQEAVASVLAQMIELLGEEATLFLSPVEYLEYAKSPQYQKPIAVFTDVNMPRINGYELIGKISEAHPKTKFVIVSGRPDFEHGGKKLACLYLSKPFHPHDIQQIIHTLKACSNSQPSPELGCATLCDCPLYNADGWSCPHIKERQPKPIDISTMIRTSV